MASQCRGVVANDGVLVWTSNSAILGQLMQRPRQHIIGTVVIMGMGWCEWLHVVAVELQVLRCVGVFVVRGG